MRPLSLVLLLQLLLLQLLLLGGHCGRIPELPNPDATRSAATARHAHLLSSLSRQHPSAHALLPGEPRAGPADPMSDPATATVFTRGSPLLAGARPASAFRAAPAPPPSFPASQRTADLDMDLVQTLAKLTSIAYCSNDSSVEEWACARCAEVPGFEPYRVVFDPVWDLLAYVGYLPSLNARVVVFRGTDSSSWYNWVENMRYWRTDRMYPVPNAPHAKIHYGFLMLWNASSLGQTVTEAFRNVTQMTDPDAKTYVVGHSMGGALAQLCALDLKFLLGLNDMRVFTFGAPRLGNNVFQQFFNSYVNESWRFTHNRDIVPSVPLEIMGFHHVAREVWLVDVASESGEGIETQLVVCDSSGEDASCHNSVCYLGLCNSVADHMVYAGVNMFHDDDLC